MSVVTVSVEIDPQREVEARVRKINEDILGIGGGAGAKPAGVDNLVRSLEAAQSRTLSLQSTFTRLAAQSPLSRAGQDAARAANETQRLQQRLIAVYQTRDGKPLASLEREIDATSGKLSALQQKMFRLQSGTGAARGTGGELGSGIASGLGIPIGAAAIGAAGAGALLYGGKAALDAGRAAETANRSLASSAKEAGLAYDDLNRKSKSFGELTGITRTEANRTTAALTDLARLAGRPQDLELIQKRFADLAAAKGIDPNQISTIARQVIAGEDEGINRLGLPNPSKIYEEYAKSIGVATDKLSQQQQVTAILDAVMRKSMLFSGEAEKRLASGAGQFDLFTSRAKNAFAELGKSAVRDLGGVLSYVNKLQAADFKGDLISGSINAGYAAYRRVGIEREEAEAKAQIQRVAEAYKYVENVLKEAARVSIEARKVLRNDPIYIDPLRLTKDVEATRAGGDFFKSAEAARKREAYRGSLDDKGQQQFDRERAAYEQQQIAGRTRLGDEQERKAKEVARKDEQAQKQALERVRGVRNDVGKLLSEMTREAGQNNPFVSLFTSGEAAAESMRKRLSLLGDESVNQFIRIEAKARETQAFALRIESSLRTFDLNTEARRLGQPQTGTNAEQDREFAVLQKRFAALTQAPDLRRQADAFERGFAVQNPLITRGDRIAEYDRIKSLSPAGNDEAARRAQSLIDDYILERTKNLTTQARNSADPVTRALASDRAGALGRRADRFESEVQDEIARAQAGRFGVQTARAKLGELSRFGGIDNAEVRKQFLAVSGQLDPRELTGDLRRGRIGALEREAQAEATKEQDAKRAVADAKAQRDAQLAKLDDLIKEVRAGNKTTILEIRDKSGTFDVLGQQPVMEQQ